MSILRFPKTYPNLAGPIFTLEKPIKGLSDAQVTKLSHEISLQVQKLRGSEMVFTVSTQPLSLFCLVPHSRLVKIITFCQDWISTNVTPPEEVFGSLAVQMKQRALDEERVCIFSLFPFIFF